MYIDNDTLTKLLYDNDSEIAISLVLADLDMISAIPFHVDHEETIKQNISNYDKLMMADGIHALVNINNKLHKRMTTQIINYGGSYRGRCDMVMLYVCGYKIVHNNLLCPTSVMSPLMIDYAMGHSMRINKLYLCNYRTTAYVSPNIDFHTDQDISICKSFAKTLRVLTASTPESHMRSRTYTDMYKVIGDDDIQLCVRIENLNADNNNKITTCKPFATSLRVLSARGSCGINNDGLQPCTNIVDLTTDSNGHITTCEPFANSLRILSAREYIFNDTICGISDDALKSCTSIEILKADGNTKITTCKPFAESLRILSIKDSCGISNDGLSLCENITNLDAMRNYIVTTCEPFAKSLRILNASESCTISDNGLQSCTNIENINISSNKNITTCKPFAKSLRVLSAYGSCGSTYGITNDGLRDCLNIEELNITNNINITTCDPFAKFLRILHACGSYCGLSDDGLRKCANMSYIDAQNNNKISGDMIKRLIKKRSQ